MVCEGFDMIGLWQYNLNKKIADEGENIVTLDSILVHINIKDRKFELNSEYSTIRYINKEEYTKDVYSYVEPEFHESYHKSEFSPRFILFSAPGSSKCPKEREIVLKKYKKGYQYVEKWYRRKQIPINVKENIRKRIPSFIKKFVRKFI